MTALNLDELRRVVLDLRVAVDDGDAVTEDMLLPPSQRELGPATQRKTYREAHKKTVACINYLLRLVDGSASPEGGTDPVH
jgi:hypothetical protein